MFHSPLHRTARVGAVSLLTALVCTVAIGSAAAQAVAPDAQKRVLVLHLTQRESGLSRPTEEAYQRLLGSALGDRLDYYSEYVDIYRFADAAYRQSLREFLRARYGPIGLDLVIAPNTAPLRLVRDEDGPLFGDVPIVFHAGVGAEGDDRSTGVVSRVDLVPILQTALDLHPHTRRVVVVVGTNDFFDVSYGNLARAQFQAFADRLTFEYLVGQPVPEMEQALAGLPDDTLVFYIAYSQNLAGERWLPIDALTRLAAASRVPVYGAHEGMLGAGIVGGRLFSTQATVEATADLALRVLGGESPASIPVREIEPYITVFDARQLSRWDIDEAVLPSGAAVMFRPISPWQRYRTAVLVAVGVVALVVGVWWLERGRRRRAEIASRGYLDAMTHLARRVTAGHFSASLAHELRQPLTAIQNNADAARRLLDQHDVDVPELRAILSDIDRDDQRAADIIQGVRSLVQHHVSDAAAIDIDVLLGDTLALVKPIANAKSVRIDVVADTERGFVLGDRVHLQQAIMNVVLNALDAVEDLDAGERRVTIRTHVSPSDVEIVVHDRGAGIADEIASRVFEPFVTTKPNGMGMGLFIVRSIMDAHGGRVVAANDPSGGTVVRLELRRIESPA